MLIKHQNLKLYCFDQWPTENPIQKTIFKVLVFFFNYREIGKYDQYKALEYKYITLNSMKALNKNTSYKEKDKLEIFYMINKRLSSYLQNR